MEQMKKEISKDHELLIRIDERITLLIDRLVKVEQLINSHREQSNENRIRLEKIELDLYGKDNYDGLMQKVEKHDRLLLKFCAIFTVIAVGIDFLFKFLGIF